MPMITVAYATSRSEAGLKAAVPQAATDLAAQVLHKDSNVTAVLVQAVDPADWFCARHSLAQSGLAAFWLEIRITEGTTPRTRRPRSSPRYSSAWVSSSGPCTRTAMSMPTTRARTATALAE